MNDNAGFSFLFGFLIVAAPGTLISCLILGIRQIRQRRKYAELLGWEKG
jgi:hypothetical protein